MVSLAQRLESSKAQLANLVPLMAARCIRSQPFARSSLQAVDEDLIYAFCSKASVVSRAPDLRALGPCRGPPSRERTLSTSSSGPWTRRAASPSSSRPGRAAKLTS